MKAEPLPFAPPRLSDAPEVRALTSAAVGSDLSFANLYLLQEKYATTIAAAGGFLFRHYAGNGRLQGYAFPCGSGDWEAALQRIESDAAARKRPLKFCLLTEAEKTRLEQLRPQQFRFDTDPGNADYLYNRRDLAELPGTVYHRKRNHISRFEKLYPRWHFAPLTPENAGDALQIAQSWLENRNDAALLHELHAIRHALEHLNALQLCGGIIYVEQLPVAMSVVSYISPAVADVHYEKCLPAFRAAYPVINRNTAQHLQGELINREEDLNHPGLRRAKESYHPTRILRKYTASPLSPC